MILSEVKDSEDLTYLKYILVAGEPLRGNDVEKFIKLFYPRIKLVNLYGTTETTMAKSFYIIKEGDEEKANIPVGKGIDYAELLVLNDNMQICPRGVIGQVYIRTPFITSGYCNDKELTKKVFIKNPLFDNPNDIIYKTGDLGKRLDDDNIEVLGRIDNQVKIRGNRIDLGEVENRLLKHQLIDEAIVIEKLKNLIINIYVLI
jgi:non-ribosomal peptide synthetase component F